MESIVVGCRSYTQFPFHIVGDLTKCKQDKKEHVQPGTVRYRCLLSGAKVELYTFKKFPHVIPVSLNMMDDKGEKRVK